MNSEDKYGTNDRFSRINDYGFSCQMVIRSNGVIEMIKAQITGWSEVESISLKDELNKQTFFHPRPAGTSDYGKFERYVTFWRDGVNYHVTECKSSKWYQKQPHYRPTGKSTYRLLIITWDENGQNPVYQHADFESLSQIEKQLKG